MTESLESPKLVLALEPESAAIACDVHQKANPGESFMVLDTGGGTVDITMNTCACHPRAVLLLSMAYARADAGLHTDLCCPSFPQAQECEPAALRRDRGALGWAVGLDVRRQAVRELRGGPDRPAELRHLQGVPVLDRHARGLGEGQGERRAHSISTARGRRCHLLSLRAP